MGLVFLLAGLTKIWDPVLFFWQALPHIHIFPSYQATTAIATFALVLGPLEALVGLALLIDWKPRLVLPVGVIMMASFILISAKSWYFGTGGNCGCFGSLVNRSPGESLLENLIFIGLLLFSWSGLRRRSVPLEAWRRWVVVASGLSFLLVLGFRYLPERDHIGESHLQVGFHLGTIPVSDSAIDLTRGAYLVELFSPTCRYCQQAVPKLNALVADPNVPQIIALSRYAQDDPKIVQFKKQYQPRFEIVTIPLVDFTRLVWGHGIPRMAYLQDGVVKQVWKSDVVPSLAELQQLSGQR